MNIVFFDSNQWESLQPLTLTKPLAELRMGFFSFHERWKKLIDGNFSFLTKPYLETKFPLEVEKLNLFINPAYFPDNELLVLKIKELQPGEALVDCELQVIAANCDLNDFQNAVFTKRRQFDGELLKVEKLWDLVLYNDRAIRFDFDLQTKGKVSQPISSTNGVLNPKQIFVEEGAKVEFCTLNANLGPIYIGANAEIMEGSHIRGSFALCENATVNMGTKIYSGTTIGPYCKVGGELNNSILMGYSNKGHDGFLGNSVVGEWCNLGANTNNSNLKNNYSDIKIWDFSSKKFANSGLQFFGLVMGDYSKSAINTRFNTGTVVGVSANIFTEGFPPKFVPSFSWGGGEEDERYDLEKSYEATDKMMQRRKKLLTKVEKNILHHLYLN